MMPEDHKRGQVSWEVYKEFFKISGGFAFFALMFFCMFSWGALSTSANI